MTLTLNQTLLLKSCFLDQGTDYFNQWLSLFDESDLDQHTRAVIPILSSAIPIDLISPMLNRKLARYKQQSWLLNSKKWQQLKPIFYELSQVGVTCCLLKGAAMTLFYYQNIGQRPEHADIDILIKKEDINHVVNVLKKHGFTLQPSFLWNRNELEHTVCQGGAVLNSLHALHYVKDRLVIDVHWHLLPIIHPICYRALENSMLAQAKFGTKLYYLCPEMQLIHAATHAAIQNTECQSINGTIDLCYLLHSNLIDPERLKSLCSHLGVAKFVLEGIQRNKAFISNDIYKCYESLLKKTGTIRQNVIAHLFYSHIKINRRIAAFYFFLIKNNYNVFKCAKSMQHYFGLPSFKQLCLHILKNYIFFGR